MDTPHRRDPLEASQDRNGDRLESWKEIAAYLRRTVRTVHRWEKEEGLPVHRHVHKKLGSVYAYRQELDAWIARSETVAGRRLAFAGTPSADPEANGYFEQAILALKAHNDIPRVRRLLQRAVERDPSFAEARAWLAFSHYLELDNGYSNNSGLLYEAEAQALKALEADSGCAAAHSVLGAVCFLRGRKDLMLAELSKARAIQPDEINAAIWQISYHLFSDEYEAGIAEASRLLERDPVIWPARIKLGLNLLCHGDGAAAIREFEKVLEQDSQNAIALVALSWARMRSGELGLARDALEGLRPGDQHIFVARTAKALLLALECKPAAALHEADDEVLKYAASVLWGTHSIVAMYAVLRDGDTALEWLDRAVRLGDARVRWFQRDPLLANLREHPRFRQIVDSILYRGTQQAGARARG